MSEVSVAQAVKSLRPGTSFWITDDDVENMIWHTEGVEPLTQAEVTAEVARLEQEAIDKQAAKETAVKSGRAKLLALGLTNEEVEAMTNG